MEAIKPEIRGSKTSMAYIYDSRRGRMLTLCAYLMTSLICAYKIWWQSVYWFWRNVSEEYRLLPAIEANILKTANEGPYATFRYFAY